MKYTGLEYLLKLCGCALGMAVISNLLIGFFEGVSRYIGSGEFVYHPSYSSSDGRITVMFLLVGLAWPYLKTIVTMEKFLLAVGLVAVVIAYIASNGAALKSLYFPFYLYVPLVSFLLLRHEGTPIYYLLCLALLSAFLISFHGIELFFKEGNLQKVKFFSDLFFGRGGFFSVFIYLFFILFSVRKVHKTLKVDGA